MDILTPEMYILTPEMYILAPEMYIFAPKMDKSLPFEKVQPQWQLLYLFLRVCTTQKVRADDGLYRKVFNLSIYQKVLWNVCVWNRPWLKSYCQDKSIMDFMWEIEASAYRNFNI